MNTVLIIFAILILIGIYYLIFLLTSKKKDNSIEMHLKNIANDVLISNQKSFLNLAHETFDKILLTEKSDLNQTKTDFISLIDPIKTSLEKFNLQVSELEKNRLSSYSDLKRQINDLIIFQQDMQKTTSELSKALSAPPSSGQWGEMQLRRVVELAGMIPYCDFLEQQVTDAPFSRLRPDMIIRLPKDRNIIVDAKTSLNDYMKFVNTGDIAYLDEHIRHLKKHIKDLGQKAYWDQFSHTPEFVLMFLPGESFFSNAVKRDSSLIEFGINEKVIITTPLTLIAVLKAIAFTWHQEAVSINAREIGEVGRILCSKLEKLLEGVEIFGKRLYKNIEEFEKINGYIKKEILPTTNQLKSLGLDINEKKIEADH